MKNFARLALLLVFLLHSLAAFALTLPTFHAKPKLVVVIVVDQFRADYLTRFHSRFLPAAQKNGMVGGYGWLTSQGAYFPFAEYDLLQCMTGPGHATILTGSYAYLNGIPLNYWYDEKLQRPAYCVQDESSLIVGISSGRSKGISPRNLQGTTVGDELKNAGYASRVVAVALKDRAAVLLGGHRADLAMWFDSASVSWASSRHYLPDGELPAWIKRLNEELAKRKGEAYEWKPAGKPTGLSATSAFPHSAKIGSREAPAMPFGLEVTVQAAERALKEYKLGTGPATDILALSFSSHDYMGHLYGPNSLEMEEMTVAEDRVLSHLLNTVRTSVPGGLKNVLVVLTADHGMPPDAKWARSVRLDAGTVDGNKAIEALEKRLSERFGAPKKGKWLHMQADLNFYLNQTTLQELSVAREAAETLVKEEVARLPGVAFVFTRTEYLRRTLPPQMLERQILKTYVPGKSGDVVAIPRPFFMMEEDAVNHMTSYSYDRTVPLVIAGPRVTPGVYATRAEVVDLAPTLSFLLNVLKPATAEGRVLSEILK